MKITYFFLELTYAMLLHHAHPKFTSFLMSNYSNFHPPYSFMLSFILTLDATNDPHLESYLLILRYTDKRLSTKMTGLVRTHKFLLEILLTVLTNIKSSHF